MTVRIDARGMRCPWPAIRLARALREGAGVVEIIADDPAASTELAAVANRSDMDISPVNDGSGMIFRVSPRPSVNPSFTRGH
jgi:tRNA 2-thiouridine synthesizing protein A